MGEAHQQQQAASSSRMGLRNVVGGEIVEVQGGHIVRSTGRKDRHSKVCTAKGPRDRRVRLSAHTAIQFYDVQDRLGYDRPSKAVDWLIKKAQAAIDELAQLPAWNPTAVTVTAAATTTTATTSHHPEDEEKANQVAVDGDDDRVQMHRGNNPDPNPNPNPNQSPSFLPPSLDSDTIADTIKSFFPMGASGESSSSSVHFQSYPPDLLSRTSSQNQDLRLSLQSFQDPMLLHHHHHHHPTQSHSHQQQQQQQQQQQALFSPLGFDAPSATWSEHQAAEMGRFQRMVAWNAGAESSAGGGFLFNSPPTPTPAPPPLQPLFGQSQMYSQRGPLQSSNTPSIRAWIDPPIAAAIDHHHQTTPVQPSMISGIGFVPGGFSGFRIPARIRGEEEHDGISDKPSSASSDSRH